ncbi:MAG: CRISPR-associated endonuclease Cas3'', partial [Clostridiales bacterium]|nr:CRISPR-associated endonuclease Cas3'' [Clostridiales bacterium]
MYIAHIRESDGKEQTLSSHCRNVAALCSRGAEIAGLSRLAELIGLTHDMGKATDEFADYLRAALRDDKANSPHHHAPTGAIYAYRRWFMRENASACERAAAQIAMLCILGHHAGLTDCLDVKGQSSLLDKMQAEAAPVHADKAIAWFLQNIADEAELDALFESACRELSALFHDLDKPSADTAVALGLISRLMLSALVDADRWDSACFEYDENPFEAAAAPDWNALLNTFERFRQTHLSGEGEINRIRADISDLCWQKAASETGIVTLSVPTGGGKTFSSLRYALRHAALNGQRRLFYIIP